MKYTTKFLGVAAVAFSIVLGCSMALADGRGSNPSSGGFGGNFIGGDRTGGSFSEHHGGAAAIDGHRGGFSDGDHRGGFSGEHHHGGSWDGDHNRGTWNHYRGWGWGGYWYPWDFSFSYDYTPYPDTYYNPSYDDTATPPPVEEYTPPTVYVMPGAADANAAEPEVLRGGQNQPLGLADIKALVKANVGDDVILSQIRNSRVAYHLTTAEIIDLKQSGVSEKIIDYMINTAN